MTLKLGVLVSGSGTNMSAILEAIRGGRLDAHVQLVISNNPDAPALEKARRAGVEAISLDHRRFPDRAAFEDELVASLASRGVEWIALAGFMRVLTPRFLGAFPGRVVNIHPSLLPAFRGVDAQKQALDYGVRVTGCTVHFVSPEVDAGAILVQRPVTVRPGESLDSLRARILAEEHEAFVEALNLLAAGRATLVAAAGERPRVVFTDAPSAEASR